MHPDEIGVDTALVRRLLAEQFPRYADLPVSMVRSTGTVNAICRLGQSLCVRLPRVAAWAGSLDRECTWLPRIAAHVSLAVPEPVARGRPTGWYPFPWAIYRWIDGSPYREDLIDDERVAAGHLASFVRELRMIDEEGAPRGGRAPLAELDTVTQAAIDEARSGIDADAALSAWRRCLQARPWDGRHVWIHADLLRSNLLVRGGRLSAVLDFGSAGVGDPAMDVVPAWSVFNAPGRDAYRHALRVDDNTWERARGYALHQALRIIPYYAGTNPGFVESARRTVTEVVTDLKP